MALYPRMKNLCRRRLIVLWTISITGLALGFFSVNPFDVKCVSVAEDFQPFHVCTTEMQSSYTLIQYSRNAEYELEETNHQNNNDHLSENEND